MVGEEISGRMYEPRNARQALHHHDSYESLDSSVEGETKAKTVSTASFIFSCPFFLSSCILCFWRLSFDLTVRTISYNTRKFAFAHSTPYSPSASASSSPSKKKSQRTLPDCRGVFSLKKIHPCH